MEKISIGISGLMGSGKSTLGCKLSAATGLTLHLEPYELNPWIMGQMVTSEPSDHNFDCQAVAIALGWQNAYKVSRLGGIVDAPFVAEEIYTRALYYLGWINMAQQAELAKVAASLPKVTLDLHFVLVASLDTIKERITKRGRAFESTIEDSYLEALKQAYETWLYYAVCDRAKKTVVVETDNLSAEGVLETCLKYLS